jgi:hypothetical protein
MPAGGLFESAAERPKAAQTILRLIAGSINSKLGGTMPRSAMPAPRQEHFALPLKRLRQPALALQATALPKSGLGQACAYLLAHLGTAHRPSGS